jgi:hypothetical protein
LPADYYNPYDGLFGATGTWHKCQFHLHHVRANADATSFIESLEPVQEIFHEYKTADFSIVGQSSYGDLYDTAQIAAEVGLTSINGQEYVRYDGILLMGISSFKVGSPQAVVDAAVADGGFAVICHPNQNPRLQGPLIPPLLTWEMSRTLTGVVGVEVYNGCLPRRQMGGVGFGSGIATDYWDEALSSGRRLWAFASDDSHDRYEINVGWTEIWADSTDFPAIKASIERGSIVASRGMRLFGWEFEGEALTVEADLPYVRTYDTEYRFVGRGGEVLHTDVGRRATYRLRGDESYVRVQASNPDGSILWTQPLLRSDAFELPTRSS